MEDYNVLLLKSLRPSGYSRSQYELLHQFKRAVASNVWYSSSFLRQPISSRGLVHTDSSCPTFTVNAGPCERRRRRQTLVSCPVHGDVHILEHLLETGHHMVSPFIDAGGKILRIDCTKDPLPHSPEPGDIGLKILRQ